MDTLRERVIAGLRESTRELEVLRDVSFEVERGEFLGVVGCNGCGKSTLLKLIAGIYRPDAGEIRAAGRLAPIIELGVGFNNELEAFDNVVMNAVMMGLEPAEARDRYPEILAFSELEDFAHLPLKNYSSGMRARLGFSIMVHVDADLLLFDEVLAVGDAGFQEKCATTFRQLRASDRTGVLVTHSMEALERHCERALLLEEGRVHAFGTVHEVAREYSSLGARRLSSDSPIGFVVCSCPSKDSRQALPSRIVSRWTGLVQMYCRFASVSWA